MSHMPFSMPLQPVVAPLEYIALIGQQKNAYFQVTYVEPIPGLNFDFGVLAAGASTNNQTLTNADMERSNQLAQYRITILDDIDVQIQQPQAKTRYTVKNTVAKLTYNSTHEFPQLSEVYKFEDVSLVASITNNTGFSINNSRMILRGFHYLLTPIDASDTWNLQEAQKRLQGRITPLPTEGYGAQTR